MHDDAAPDWAGHQPGTWAYRRVLIALMLAGFATFAQLYTPQGVLPLIARDLGVDAASSALLVSASTVGIAAGVLPWAWLADRIGRVRAMVTSLSVSATLGLALPFWPELTGLVALRFIEGFALACLPAVAIVYLFEELDRRNAAAAAGTYIAGTTVGGLLGRLITAPLADLLGWRLGMAGTSIIIAASVVVFIVVMPRARGFVLVPKSQRVSVWRGVRHHMRDPAMLGLFTIGGLMMGVLVTVYNYLAFHLEAPPFGLPATIAGLLFLTYLTGTASSRLVWRFVPGRGTGRVQVAAIGLTIVGLLITLVPWLPAILVGLIAMTVGFFATHSLAAASVGARATVAKTQATSLYNLFYYAGSSLFGWLGGYLFAGFGWPGVVAMVVLLAIASGVLARMQPTG